jgi:L-lactate dehydrogenase complex protein LldG
MSAAREAVLARVRSALADVPGDSGPDAVEVPRGYVQRRHVDDVPGLFAERVADYQATVVRVGPGEVTQAVQAALVDAGARSVVVPGGYPAQWLPADDAGIDVLGDDPPLSVGALDAVAAVVTGATVAMAVTGTIVLDHGSAQGRRALTLVPDMHVCVITEDQVVADVPEGIDRLRAAVEAGRPLTWISGPSATSDIELDRVEGVHGPRTLVVVLVGEDSR